MSSMLLHPHHLVQESPWPLLSSAAGGLITMGLISWFHSANSLLMGLALVLLLLIVAQWWRDVSLEGGAMGLHPKDVEGGLRWGMILFIASEVLFFVSFFWAFYHSSLCPNVDLGSVWPPLGIHPFNAFEVPFLNTVVLLSSGVSVTWAHHKLMGGSHSSALSGLVFTIFLGVYFSALQALEYFEAPFSMADSVYGSTFFIATGFHGLHVIIGSLFLAVSLLRLRAGHFSGKHHFGFEAAAWYWHFVDVVWLFLFVSIYWWGGN